MVLLMQCYDNFSTSVNLNYGFTGIRANQKLNWKLEENKQNKITAEMLIVSIQSGGRTATTLFCCYLWCYLFFALDATTNDSEGRKYH